MMSITTVCNGKKETWPTRKQAEDHFYQAMLKHKRNKEEDEAERCYTIYEKLTMGMYLCSDGYNPALCGMYQFPFK